MKKGGLYLAVYDVTIDRERNRVAKLLEGYGMRIQKSDFEIRLTREQRESVLEAVERLALESGWVAFYRIDEDAARLAKGKLPEQPLGEQTTCYLP
jgi:CRISPR-associated endonuclease Cas2